MLRLVQGLICYTILISLIFAVAEARPQSNELNENNLDMESIEPDTDEARSAYGNLPNELLYPSIPLDRLRMFIAQYRPKAYGRLPYWNNMNGLYRTDEPYQPESKRQVKYRQCYFNPISCFKK